VPIKSEANNLGIRMLLWMSGYRRQNMIRKKPVERKVEGLCISYYKKGDRISSYVIWAFVKKMYISTG
jgi:hypothetical protein